MTTPRPTLPSPTLGSSDRLDQMVLCRQLSKVYRSDGVEVTALREIDLTINSGEFVAIMGPSGCGKSTLLHLLGGLDRPTAGEISFQGRRVDGLSETKWAILRRRQIGIVFQFFNLVTNLSVSGNVELPALLAGTSSSAAHRRRIALLDELGIGNLASAYPSTLSGGQQQRVALARALVNQPALLLADEPTGNLDSQSTREVLNLLRQMHASGQTIVMVTHDASVASIADRVISMRDGRIIDETAFGAGEVPLKQSSQLFTDLFQMES
jgi:putative ABC transport system ATP-binding protein